MAHGAWRWHLAAAPRLRRGSRTPASADFQPFRTAETHAWSHFLSENRHPPRIKSGACFFRKML